MYDIRVERHKTGVVRDLQQLTVNIFQDMGVLPASLDPRLRLVDVPEDETPPSVSLTRATLSDGVVQVVGTAADHHGNVAAVEVSWGHGRWHAATLDKIAPNVTWTLAWGDQECHAESDVETDRNDTSLNHRWHAAHGDLPPTARRPFHVRAADDSGNAATFDDLEPKVCPTWDVGERIPA